MININFTADAIPEDFSGTFQDFQDRFLTNLRGTIDSASVLGGQIGGVDPDSDIGPWLDGTTWKVWNGSGYVPTMVKVGGAGYVVQLGNYTTSGDQSILPDRIQTLQDKDGTVALLSDVYVGRPCVTLSGATPTIDWNLSNHFTQVLPSNVTVTQKNSQPGQRIVVTLKNNGTSYTVTWSGPVFWPSGSAPTQTASSTDKYVLENIGGSILAEQVADYS